MSSLVTDLLERGLVEEADTATSGRVGRPATAVAIAGRRIGAMGLEVNIDYVAACIVDLTGSMRVRHRHNEDNRSRQPYEVFGRVHQLATQAMSDAIAQGIDCVGATIALPGLVDPATGTLFVAPNLHWLGVDGSLPAEQLRLPPPLSVQSDNEANLGALAELWFGAGQARSSFVYVSGGVGIGAGLVVDGALVRGAHGFAGELGHVVVDPDGQRCECGARGCLETLAGRDALARRNPAQAADALVAALRSVVHLIDPEVIVLGGTFAELGDEFAVAVASALADNTLGSRWHACEVVPSALAPDSTLIGAGAAPLRRVLADPTIVPARRMRATS